MVTVLIADDDARVRLLLRSTLGGAGHVVLEAADGAGALRMLREVRPAVAVLDVRMPAPSGLDVCRAVRADPDLAGTWVVIVSGDAPEADALAAGADAFLAKPLSPRRLLAVVADLAGHPSARPAPRPLRELRAERLLAIRDLARLAGVAPMTVHAVEAGTLAPGPRVIRRLARALGVEPDDVAEFRTDRVELDEHALVARLEAMGYPRVLALRIARRPR